MKSALIGTRPGQYGQDIFTLKSAYFEGRPPKSVNMHWRRFAISSIPLDDAEKFDVWLRDRWLEKDALLDIYMKTGRFPADEEEDDLVANGSPIEDAENIMPACGIGHVETEVKPCHPLEFLPIFASVLAVPLCWRLFQMVWWALRIVLLIVSLGNWRI